MKPGDQVTLTRRVRGERRIPLSPKADRNGGTVSNRYRGERYDERRKERAIVVEVGPLYVRVRVGVFANLHEALTKGDVRFFAARPAQLAEVA